MTALFNHSQRVASTFRALRQSIPREKNHHHNHHHHDRDVFFLFFFPLLSHFFFFSMFFLCVKKISKSMLFWTLHITTLVEIHKNAACSTFSVLCYVLCFPLFSPCLLSLSCFLHVVPCCSGDGLVQVGAWVFQCRRRQLATRIFVFLPGWTPLAHIEKDT